MNSINDINMNKNGIANIITFEDLEPLGPLEPVDLPILPPRPTENLVRMPDFTDEEFQEVVSWFKTNYEDQLPVFAEFNERHFLRSIAGADNEGWDWTGMYISNRRRLQHSTEKDYTRCLNQLASWVLYHGEHDVERWKMPRNSYYKHAKMIKQFHDGEIAPDFMKE